MALLSALLTVHYPLSTIHCLHVEHGLRPGSRNDAEFVRNFCEKHGIECHVKHIKPGRIEAYAKRKGIGIEAAARFYRHKALAKKTAELGVNTRILTGHTKDDALELSLMRVLRGCGPAGLAVMPKEKGLYLRPLLSVSRAEIIEYLNAKGITWREDETNAENYFLRNRIRNRLIPLLDEAFPSWKSGVTAMSETQSLASEFIVLEAKQRISWDSHKGTKAQREEKGKNPSSLLPLPPRPPRLLQTFGLRSARKESIASLTTTAESFFTNPIILREEAIFQALNTLSPSSSRASVSANRRFDVPPCESTPISTPIKRSVIRKFCTGHVKAADLGSMTIKLENGKIVISRKKREFFECGVSVLIK
ncbi:MAG: tRNA lysidine(34) synthetase TilS [Treponema sp.]|nr:tRNA lysidine(34) synthetase TilS [Treponema sp.]